MRIIIFLTTFIIAFTRSLNGISFIVKTCNEITLFESIDSLKNITVPHEIILIVHHCMGFNQTSLDKANYIASLNNNVQVYQYNYLISRPGYETLATDIDSNHSLIRYYNYGVSLAKYKWIAKWDADFIMTNEFNGWINQASIWSNNNEVILMEAKNDQITETHNYFSSCLSHYAKHTFFEIPMQVIIPSTHIVHNLVNSSIYIYHKSDFNQLKPYWFQKPWYLSENSIEASIVKERMEKLIKDFGPEPIGLTRSGNELIKHVGQHMIDNNPLYVNFLD
jgi:hypothetical protein